MSVARLILRLASGPAEASGRPTPPRARRLRYLVTPEGVEVIPADASHVREAGVRSISSSPDGTEAWLEAGPRFHALSAAELDLLVRWALIERYGPHGWFGLRIHAYRWALERVPWALR